MTSPVDAASPEPAAPSRRILVVDDDPEMQQLLTALLAHLGEVDVATDGFDGIARFRAACEQQRPYDLVCLDIRMPGMDGHRTLTALRRLERDAEGDTPHAATRTLMLTAVSDRASVQRAVIAGCDGYLVKPFTPDEVMRKLQELGFPARVAA